MTPKWVAMQFLDEAKISVQAGDGGNGVVRFRREKYIQFGGPNGGNGGRGGSIIIKAVDNVNTLIDFRYQQHFLAKNGDAGQGAEKTGTSASDLVVCVPIGTQIFAEDNTTLVADLVKHNEEIIIAHGGKGGLGNSAFKSSTNRSPRQSTPGEAGERLWIWLKLKLIADVGIIGMPNAGKSTLLSKISNAKPKIADYPFTTLRPQLGLVKVRDKSFVVSDLPGLIEGASSGVGLGHKFLKHVERCKILIHLLDITEETIAKNYKVIRNELKRYSPKLSRKKELVILNKADVFSPAQCETIKKKLEKDLEKDVLLISAAANQNIDNLLVSIIDVLYKPKKTKKAK